MKKTTIHISYEEEKLTALNMYLTQKNLNIESELQSYLNTLYLRNVPASVREFIAMRGDGSPEPLVPRRKPKAAEAQPVEVPADEQ